MLQGSRHFSLLVSIVRSFFRSNQTFLHSFNQSLPPLPSYRLCLLSLSLFIFLVFGVSLVPSDSLHRLVGSSVSVQVYVFISLAPHFDLASSASPSILQIIRVSRNLILWASLHLSPILISRPPHAGLSLQLGSCGRFLSCSFWHYEQLVSVPATLISLSLASSLFLSRPRYQTRRRRDLVTRTRRARCG